jgi:hypothetical protein
MASLLLGPLLRYVGRSEATVWVETDQKCTVGVLGRTAETFEAFGHHYALVVLTGLDEGAVTEYRVDLDGEPVWPLEVGDHPPSAIHTRMGERQARLVLILPRRGARTRAVHLSPTEHEQGSGGRPVGVRPAATAGVEAWPDGLLLIGDQVYADEVSPPRSSSSARAGTCHSRPAKRSRTSRNTPVCTARRGATPTFAGCCHRAERDDLTTTT